MRSAPRFLLINMTPYYHDERSGITIYNANCLDVLPSLAPGSADLVLTDPPFEAEAHTLQRRVQHESGSGEYGRVVRVESLPFPPITSEVRKAAAGEMARIAARWALVFCQIEGAPLWRNEFESAGMVYKRTCIWVKPDGMPQYSGDRPGMGYEAILAMHAPGKSEWNGGGRHGVFIHNKNNGVGAAPHPTTKPLRLMLQLIKLFGRDGSMIVDPFMGSGTTLRAAKDSGHKAIGIEISEHYCEIAAKRLSQSVFTWPDAYHEARGDADMMADALAAEEVDQNAKDSSNQ